MSSALSVKVFSLEIAEATSFVKVITTIQLIYGIPCFLLLIAFVIALGLSKHYQNSFYRLVQLDLLTNILCYLNTWISIRLEKTNTGVMIQKFLESKLPGSIDLSNQLTHFFMHMQFCSAIVLSVHRITSVKFVFSDEKFWLRFYPIYVLICSIYSVALMLLPGKSYLVSINNGTLEATYYPSMDAVAVTLTAIYSVIYFLLILIIGLFAAYLVSNKIRTLSADDRGISTKLTKIALTYCAIYSGILLWSVLTYLNSIVPWQPAIISENNFTIALFGSDMKPTTAEFPLVLTTIRKQSNQSPKKKTILCTEFWKTYNDKSTKGTVNSSLLIRQQLNSTENTFSRMNSFWTDSTLRKDDEPFVKTSGSPAKVATLIRI